MTPPILPATWTPIATQVLVSDHLVWRENDDAVVDLRQAQKLRDAGYALTAQRREADGKMVLVVKAPAVRVGNRP